MKRFLLVTIVLAAISISSAALAFGPYTSVGSNPASTLSVVRNQQGANWEWIYTLNVQNIDANPVHIFLIGLANTDASHYSGFQVTGTTLDSTPTINGESLEWYFTPISNTTATFRFLTDLQGVDIAAMGAKDGKYSVAWTEVETPGVVPEASTIMLGFLGLSSIGGILKIRKH
ncbi:MAG: hypothetical protein ABFD54_15640 [Armatimonadota bacterium]|nr:hypothetical protein [bacterium]